MSNRTASPLHASSSSYSYSYSSSSSSRPSCSSCSSSSSSSTTLTCSVVSTSSPGYKELFDRLSSPTEKFPEKARKLAIFILARDKEAQPIRNRGNTLRLLPPQIRAFELMFSKTPNLSNIRHFEVLPKLKASLHVYRQLANHHIILTATISRPIGPSV